MSEQPDRVRKHAPPATASDHLPANTNKCSEFVDDTVAEAGAEANFAGRPALAGELRNPKASIANWRPLKADEKPQPGDIAAIRIQNPRVGATGHAGIVISDGKGGTTVISAHDDVVSTRGASWFSPLNDVTYRRYTGD